MLIRIEEESDRAAVHALNTATFPTRAEADLVDRLRRTARPFVSLVAEIDGAIVGHILFSAVDFPGRRDLSLMGLGPMAVAPAHRRQGVGSALVLAGLEACRKLGIGAVVVLGHARYYPRFGFTVAARCGIACEYDAPEDAFMLLELRPGHLRGVSGTVKYDPAFGDC
jgi:putative acetyltransferase